MTTEDYAFAESEFHHFKRALADYAARLAEAAAALRERTDSVSFEHVGLGLPLSPVGAGAATVIDGAALPKPVDIQHMLIRYRGAYDRLRATWDGLPPAERPGLRPPPANLPTLVPARAD